LVGWGALLSSRCSPQRRPTHRLHHSRPTYRPSHPGLVSCSRFRRFFLHATSTPMHPDLFIYPSHPTQELLDLKRLHSNEMAAVEGRVRAALQRKDAQLEALKGRVSGAGRPCHGVAGARQSCSACGRLRAAGKPLDSGLEGEAGTARTPTNSRGPLTSEGDLACVFVALDAPAWQASAAGYATVALDAPAQVGELEGELASTQEVLLRAGEE
jgi:hypothetical protein